MKTLKRSILYMTKKYLRVRDCELCVYNTKKEKEYLTENGSVTFYFDDEDRVIGMYKAENGIATNYEWSGK